MTFNVLLATSDPMLRERLGAQLGELPDVHLAGATSTSNDLLAMLVSQDDLHALLLDESMGPLPTADMIRDITMSHPHLAVILIVAEVTKDDLSAAMSAGARGVVSMNPSLEDLETRISTAAEWSRSIRRLLDGQSTVLLAGQTGRMLALAGAKGGTGTTTLAVHLALAVARARRTVCLVDMDLQSGDIPTYLDVSHRRSIVDLAEAADDLNPTVLADTLYAHRLGPHVLLAPAEGERGEDLSGRAARQILGSLRSRYDVVIVDCGSHFVEASAMAVEMADRVLITTTADTPSLRGTRRVLELWERLQARKRDDLGVVLTHHHRQSEIQPDFARKILNVGLLATTVPECGKALESAANTGTPTDVEDPGFRRSIARITRDLGLLGVPANAPAGSLPLPAGAEPQAPHGHKRKGKEKRAARARAERKAAGQAGQATVEFIGMLPLIILLVLLLWEATVAGMAMIQASHGANEGARAAAVGKPAGEAAKKQMTPSFAADAHVADSGDEVTVTVPIPMLFPSMGSPWSVSSSAEVVHE